MFESADAICPFYRRHSKKDIRCEEGKRISLRGIKQIRRHILRVCGTDKWKECPVARELMKKY